MAVHLARSPDAARLGQRVQPRRDVDPVAEQVAIAFHHHIAQRDADPQRHARPPRGPGGASSRRCTSTPRPTASTALGNSEKNPSPIVLNSRPLCAAMAGSSTCRRRSRTRRAVVLMLGHHAGIADHVGDQDGSEPAPLSRAPSGPCSPPTARHWESGRVRPRGG